MSEGHNFWTLYFDSSSSSKDNAGASIVLEAETGRRERYYKDLGPGLTCNQAEYAALISGLEIAKGKQINDLKVVGNSRLVCMQARENGKSSLKNYNPLTKL